MAFFTGGFDLFLTHNWYYTDPWQQLVGALDAHAPGQWRNWSLPWHDTSIERSSEKGKAQLERLLRGQISMAALVVVIPETASTNDGRMWLETQLRFAADHAKPVVGVQAMDGSFPAALVPHVREVIARDAAAILDASFRHTASATAPAASSPASS